MPSKGDEAIYIEKMMNKFLMDLDDADKLWSEMGIGKSQCIAGYNNIEDDPNLNAKQKKAQYKKWFHEKSKEKYFGTKNAILFKGWAKHHSGECRKFCFQVCEALRSVKASGFISKEKEIQEKIKKKFHNESGK